MLLQSDAWGEEKIITYTAVRLQSQQQPTLITGSAKRDALLISAPVAPEDI